MVDAVASSHIRFWYDVANMDQEGKDYGGAVRWLGKERICRSADLRGRAEVATGC
jgi:hypothetical protein